MKSKNNKNILKTLGIVLVVVVFSFLVLYLTNSNIVEGMKTNKTKEGKQVTDLQKELNEVLNETSQGEP
tara:strand:- start:13761 stop:13967 length:207 start_codon:yes stop_codon:yes gene_type:complete